MTSKSERGNGPENVPGFKKLLARHREMVAKKLATDERQARQMASRDRAFIAKQKEADQGKRSARKSAVPPRIKDMLTRSAAVPARGPAVPHIQRPRNSSIIASDLGWGPGSLNLGPISDWPYNTSYADLKFLSGKPPAPQDSGMSWADTDAAQGRISLRAVEYFGDKSHLSLLGFVQEVHADLTAAFTLPDQQTLGGGPLLHTRLCADMRWAGNIGAFQGEPGQQALVLRTFRLIATSGPNAAIIDSPHMMSFLSGTVQDLSDTFSVGVPIDAKPGGVVFVTFEAILFVIVQNAASPSSHEMYAYGDFSPSASVAGVPGGIEPVPTILVEYFDQPVGATRA